MSVLIADSQKQLEQLLVSDNLITKEKIDELHIKSKKTGEPFLSLVIKEGGVSNEDLTRLSSAISKVPYVNLLNAKINGKILDLLPLEVAERYMAVPLGEMDTKLVVAMLDANNVQAVDFLANRIGRQLSVYMASQEGIENVLKQYQLNVAVDVKATLGSKSEEQKNSKNTDIQTLVQDSPISKALTTIMEFAARSGASDIHIEPLEKELKIRCRIDGILKEIMKLPKSTEPPLISRIKILSNLKMDEHLVIFFLERNKSRQQTEKAIVDFLSSLKYYLDKWNRAKLYCQMCGLVKPDESQREEKRVSSLNISLETD